MASIAEYEAYLRDEKGIDVRNMTDAQICAKMGEVLLAQQKGGRVENNILTEGDYNALVDSLEFTKRQTEQLFNNYYLPQETPEAYRQATWSISQGKIPYEEVMSADINNKEQAVAYMMRGEEQKLLRDNGLDELPVRDGYLTRYQGPKITNRERDLLIEKAQLEKKKPWKPGWIMTFLNNKFGWFQSTVDAYDRYVHIDEDLQTARTEAATHFAQEREDIAGQEQPAQEDRQPGQEIQQPQQNHIIENQQPQNNIIEDQQPQNNIIEDQKPLVSPKEYLQTWGVSASRLEDYCKNGDEVYEGMEQVYKLSRLGQLGYQNALRHINAQGGDEPSGELDVTSLDMYSHSGLATKKLSLSETVKALGVYQMFANTKSSDSGILKENYGELDGVSLQHVLTAAGEHLKDGGKAITADTLNEKLRKNEPIFSENEQQKILGRSREISKEVKNANKEPVKNVQKAKNNGLQQ